MMAITNSNHFGRRQRGNKDRSSTMASTTTSSHSSSNTSTASTKLTSSWRAFRAYCSGTSKDTQQSNLPVKQRKKSIISLGAKNNHSQTKEISRSSCVSVSDLPSTNWSWQSSSQWGKPTTMNMTSLHNAIDNSETSGRTTETDHSNLPELTASSLLCPSLSSQEEEQEIVFETEDDCSSEGDSETSSISSEVVATGDAYWDAILQAALNDVPDEHPYDTDDDDDDDLCSLPSLPSDSDEESVDYSAVKASCDDWTDLTKDPELRFDSVPSKTTTKLVTSTVLSECLWNRDYKAVEERIMTHPEEVCMEISLPSSSSSSQPDNKTSVSRGLVLHLACAMRPLPPVSIFDQLLEVYPEATSRPESSWAMLPLHFAVNLSINTTTNNNLASLDTSFNHEDHVKIVELLLWANPKSLTTKEGVQGRTPLHLAASTTTQSVDGMVPPASLVLLQALLNHMIPSSSSSPSSPFMKHNTALWAKDMAGDTIYDIAQRECKSSMTACFAEQKWELNPILEFSPPMPHKHSEKTMSYDEEDGNSHTDATSVTMSCTTASVTEHDEEESKGERSESSLIETMQEENDSVSDCEDDASFVTARTSQDQVSVKISKPDIDLDSDRDWEHNLDLVLDSLDDKQSKDVMDPPGKNEATLADDATVTSRTSIDPPGQLARSTTQLAHSTITEYVPKAMQVNKIYLQLQLQVSDLICPRSDHSIKTALNKVLRNKAEMANPYYEIELHHPDTDVSVVLHQSKPCYEVSEATWEPIRFLVDATLAQSMGMVLRFNVYHQTTLRHKFRHNNGKKHDKVLIGSYAAPIWDLEGEIEPISLKVHEGRIMGRMKLVSYEMKALDKSDCWRIML